jgi:hypothetical protein
MSNAKPIKCGNCGAMMTVSERDGRTYHCANCDGAVQLDITGAQVAEGMRLDAQNVAGFMKQLADALTHGFGEAVVVSLGADGAIHSLEIDFEPHRFVVKRDRAKLIGQIKKLVRGVALKTNVHPIPEWVGLLQKAIADQMNSNNRVTEVLAQIVIK